MSQKTSSSSTSFTLSLSLFLSVELRRRAEVRRMQNGQRLARSGLGPSSNSHAPFRFVGLTSSESFFVALALSAGDLACSLAPRSSGRQDGNTRQYEGDLGVTCDFYSRGNASGNRGGNNQFEKKISQQRDFYSFLVFFSSITENVQENHAPPSQHTICTLGVFYKRISCTRIKVASMARVCRVGDGPDGGDRESVGKKSYHTIHS